MIVLITGSSRGIGKFIAESLLAEGNTVFGCSSSGEQSIEHQSYTHFKADIRSESDVKKMLKGIRNKHGFLDVLINNAGIASMNHFITTPVETVQRIMDVNYLGTFLVSREASKLIRKGNVRRIINFTTVASPLDLDGEAVYASSKAAIEKLTRVLAKELSESKITVNAVGPTPVDTSLISAVPKEKIESLIQKQAIKRMGTVDDVYNIVKFFMSEKSDFISGQTIYMGGVF